jgi:hypothetical protein
VGLDRLLQVPYERLRRWTLHCMVFNDVLLMLLLLLLLLLLLGASFVFVTVSVGLLCRLVYHPVWVETAAL